MLIKPSGFYPESVDSNPDNIQSTPKQTIKYGFSHIPAESLNHITSFLDPTSLLILGKVNRYLREHIKNDITWQNAFFCQLLGITPEGQLTKMSAILLRRTKTTWRDEFIFRYSLKSLWERSPTTTVTHNPHDSPIASIHLMAENGLLASSLQYGIVSRSLPLTGRVLRGFLDTFGTGLGIGNPNQEFTPNISACALASDGGTGLVLWGFRTGEISVVFASRAMERRGRASVWAIQSIDAERHDGAVLDAVWGRNGHANAVISLNAVLTAGADGRVKLWYAREAKCLWSSQVPLHTTVPDPCLKIAAELDRGVAVGAMKSGVVMVWMGLREYLPLGPPRNRPTPAVIEIRIERPSTVPDEDNSPDAPTHAPTALHVEYNGSTPPHITILVTYENHPYFYRMRVDPTSRAVETSIFGNTSLASISSVLPCFADREGHHSFVFTGDHLGVVNVYDWGATDASTNNREAIAPVRTLAAHTDGSGVSALAWNGFAFATGSTRGSVCVWDALTFEPLLVFAPPGLGPRVRARAREGEDVGRSSVNQIILDAENDMLVAAIGSRVMTWKLGTAWQVKGKKAGGTKLRKWERTSSTRYQQLQELQEDIIQSRLEFENEGNINPRRSYGSELEQRERLATLGLSEIEAVEYILMVSRDEEEMRRNGIVASSTDEGISAVDSEDSIPSGSLGSRPSRRSSSDSQSHGYITEHRIRRISGTDSNRKVQVSPRLRPEPLEAGAPPSSLTLRGPSVVRPDDQAHFPAMAAPTNVSERKGSSIHNDSENDAGKSTSRPISSKGSVSHVVASGSGKSIESAWNTPLRVALRSPGEGGGLMSHNNSASTSGSRTSLSAPTAMQDPNQGFEGFGAGSMSFDEELSMAIELSLLEAKER